MHESLPHDAKRQYHIGLAPGEVAPWVLLVGDPARAERAGALLDSVRLRRHNREYVTVTGSSGGRGVTVIGTGIGCDNMEIAVLELLECERHPTFIRVGTCGSLQPEIGIGDIVITTGAVRLESTSLAFVEEGYPAFAHHEAILALVSAAEKLAAPYHMGITASAAGFYGWQGRQGILESRFPDLPERLRRMRVANFEMESSTLLTLSSLAGLRAGVVCTVFASRTDGSFIASEQKTVAEERALRVGLGAIDFLARMDAVRGTRPFHLKPDFA
ncbi:MAG: nucleoside phosphorylase [Planctomycetota bacterium]